MKKTIIALLALAGVAAAATEVNYTLTKDATATWGDPETETLGTGITFNETDDILALTYLYTTMGTGGSASVEGSWESPTNKAYANTYAPKVQLQSGQSDSWTLTFSVKNTGEETITLTGFTFDGYCINGGGSDKSADIPVTTSLTGAENAAVTLGRAGSTGTAEFSTNFVLAAGESKTLEFTLGSAKNYATFAGLTGGSVSYVTGAAVPEPTTATLSLLALAGLAARRRRK